MIKVVCWNIGWTYQPLQELLEMDADVALLQEARPKMRRVLTDARNDVEVTPHDFWDPWQIEGFTRHPWPLVVKLSDRVQVKWFKQVIPLRWLEPHEMAVSGIGTIAAARIIPREGMEPFIATSMYARWLHPHPTAGKADWIYPDASAHRIISDLSVFIGSYDSSTHRILAAGDLNVAFSTTGRFDSRAQTIVDRMSVLGLEYMGPRFPNGRRADPVPPHPTEDSLDVPTYHTVRRSAATAHVQMDHVFASRGFHESVRTRALNGVEEWGSSDHCRILIEVGD